MMHKLTARPLRIPSLKATANDQHADPREPPYHGAAPAFQAHPLAIQVGQVLEAEQRCRVQAETDDFMRASDHAKATIAQLCDRFTWRVVLAWVQREGRDRV